MPEGNPLPTRTERVSPDQSPVGPDSTMGVPREPGAGPPPRDRTGEVLGGRYRLLRWLGSGGMGTVYLAEHVHLGRPTAIKLLHRELCLDPAAEERFRREALLAARINHASVAQVYDFDRAPEGEFFLAMEYVEGENLAERIRRHGVFPIGEAAKVLSAAAEGLDSAHALKIVHRDIKPANIMLPAKGGVKVLDFGVARPLDQSSTTASQGLVIGTPAYMSPEQLTGDPVSAATDIYALGLVFFEMLAGKVPHAGGTFAEIRSLRLEGRPPPLADLRRDCPPAVSGAVARALEVGPADRWPSAGAFARAVAEPLARPPRAGVPEGREPAVPRERSWEARFDELPLAGREREVRGARDACAAAAAGRSTVLWIEGEEGSGKSCFFDLAAREAAACGAASLVGRGFEAEVVRPYGPWRGILRDALRLAGQGAGRWPAVESLLESGTEPPAPARLFEEAGSLVQEAAARSPLFLGIEDLEWCDAASSSLFEYLGQALSGPPVLLAATALPGDPPGRPGLLEVRSRLRQRPGVVWLTLRPLTQEAVGSWLSAGLGREAPDALVRHIYGHTEGNAFFIEQVVRELVERGELESIADESVRITLEDAPPPAAVADVLKRRLQGLSPGSREVLQGGAVIGRAFDVDLVLSITGRAEEDVLEALDRAVAAGVLAPERRPAGDWYRFTHGRIRQVLAQEINGRKRRRLHQETARALEARADSTAGERAWHWYHAGDRGKAFREACRAAAEAIAAHDYDDALTHAVMAAEAAGSPGEKLAADELRGDALRRLDRPAEAAAAYAAARVGGGAEGETALNLKRKELREALLAGQVGASGAAAEARRLAEDAGSLPASRRAAIWLLISDAALAAGEPGEAEEAAEKALALASEGGDRARAGEALLALAAARGGGRKPEEAKRAARDASAAFLEIGDSHGAARAMVLLGSAEAAGAERTLARTSLEEGLKLAEKARVPRLVKTIQKKLGEVES